MKYSKYKNLDFKEEEKKIQENSDLMIISISKVKVIKLLCNLMILFNQTALLLLKIIALL